MPNADNSGWRYCDIVATSESEEGRRSRSTTEYILEQHDETGEYRTRKLTSVLAEAEHIDGPL